jgi:hypothetical protein
MIIISKSFLGFEFYKRIRVKDDVINFQIDYFNCDDIGLFVVGEYPHLEFDYVSFYQKKDWEIIAYKTFAHTILNLVINKNIQIFRYEDEKHYLKLQKTTSAGYYFKLIKPIESEDLFSQTFVNAIKVTFIKYGNRNYLDKLVHEVINNLIGKNEEYNRPQKKFVLENLKSYSKKYKWINIESENKLMGLYKNYKVKIEKIYIPRLTEQHRELKNKHCDLLKSNPRYKVFNDYLKDVIKNDFSNRYPSNDND